MVPYAEKKLASELDLGMEIHQLYYLLVHYPYAATCYDPVVIVLSNVHMMGRKNISQEGKQCGRNICRQTLPWVIGPCLAIHLYWVNRPILDFGHYTMHLFCPLRSVCNYDVHKGSDLAVVL